MRNKITSEIKQFFCKQCHKTVFTIYKVDDITYCDDCVPDEYRDLPALDGKGDPYNG